jgi:dTDP-4-dehydrorhamnose 3,5-epimerase-like enzyme
MTAPTAHCRLIDLPKIPDARGNLTFIEGGEHVPFAIRRAYWIYDVPGGERRGGHAYRTLEEFFVALSGSFDVVVDDGRGDVRHVVLNRSYFGLHVPPMTWRHLENFSTNAVCLILASQRYDEADYLRDHAEFTSARAGA